MEKEIACHHILSASGRELVLFVLPRIGLETMLECLLHFFLESNSMLLGKFDELDVIIELIHHR